LISQRPPNIVFVLTDDQGYGDLGCHGNPVIQTPNIDTLYRESVRLTDFHVGPTCAPTRAGLLTGHYHNSTGVWHTIGGRSLLRRDEWSLATALSEGGYATGLFGKWHLGDNIPYRPQERGFQTVVAHGGGGVGQTPDYWGNNYQDDTYAVNGEWRSFEGYCTDIWFNEALGFIDQNRERPFFCYISTNAPHSPYIVDEAYSDPYVGKVEHQDRADFYGMISAIDENVGKLRAKLEEWGLAETTIFIFMTDNGTSGGADLDRDQYVTGGYNAGMRGLKGSEYEGGHRVPFFVYWPDGALTGGRDVTALTANVDVMPTLLELCGVSSGAHQFDGASLVPLLEGRDDGWPDRILVTDSQRVAYPIKWRQSAAMSRQWRLINGRELYQIQVDPEQRHDVAAEHPEVVSHMREGYEAWWTRVSEQFDATIPIPVGLEAGETVLLTTHDWRNDPVECAWNQALVREGHRCNGYWEIEVAQPGVYCFELRRWPRIEDRAIIEGIPGEIKPFTAAIKDGWGGGRAMPMVRAGLRIGLPGDPRRGDRMASKVIEPEDRAVTFTAFLTAGEVQLQSYLWDAEGDETGAYFVCVQRLAT
jgi:arylsulfatase A-like enzyme